MYEVITAGRSFKTRRVGEEVEVNGVLHKADIQPLGANHFHLLLDHVSYDIEWVEREEKYAVVKVNGRLLSAELKDDTDLLLEKLGMNTKAKREVRELKAPMPGLVLDIRVSIGEEVQEGKPLIVLEAMKMENMLKSPTSGKIKHIAVKKGDPIEKNALLITFE